ncbi:MAG TPA: DUF4331 domain-containing protein [Acidimicrobiales bacterium]|nr:DUF4331 domain-containing protein [Acidimicrobiales bacterium]
MSSHREAPEISKDPVADSTDLYAFVSPDEPETVTIIANYVPLQAPAGGPNFYEFGPDVLYEIHVDNDGDGDADVTFQFRFTTVVSNPDTFLYNVGPIESLTSPNWNRRQLYSVTRVDEHGGARLLASGLACPPCNIGPLSTPDYPSLAAAAVATLPGGAKVFAGQRAEGFYVDLGAIFDLGDLRPLEQAHAQFGLNVPELAKPAAGVNSTKAVNVNTIALQLPKAQLTADGSSPDDPAERAAVIGVWTTASRQQVRILEPEGDDLRAGRFSQVSRLGNPLVNEVIIPMGKKDFWNTQSPRDDSQFAQYVRRPELAGLLNVLYPGAFAHLASFVASGRPRADLEAVLLTGLPAGVVAGFQNFTGPVLADLLRLNVAVPPSKSPSNLGILGGDLAGFPNGRRVFDDVVTIELQALAGATLPLVDPSYVVDAVVPSVSDGLTSGPGDLAAMGTEDYLASFPYLGVPHSGFDVPSS